MEHLINALVVAFSLQNIIFLLIGCFAGLIIGLLPGMGPMFAVALFLPLTFSLPAETSIIMLAAIYAATAYSDGITSVLLGVPTGPGGVAIIMDGFPLTRMGKAGLALGALAGSAIVGDTVGILVLMTLSPILANYALYIGPADYFMLTMFGLSMVALIGKGKGQVVKGLLLGCLGLILAFVGRDGMTNVLRFTFGIKYLEDGIQFVPASIGLFALSRVFIMAEEGGSIAGESAAEVHKPWKGVFSVFRYWYVTLRSSLIGVILAIMPGIGISSSSLISYMVEQRTAKDHDSYGKGNIRGVIAAQAASNATTGGELIPALSLGIPSGATSALFIAALTLHGLQPGIDFFTSGGDTVYAIFIGMFLAAVVFFTVGVTASPLLAKVTKIPGALLIPIVMTLCFVGVYAINQNVTDLLVTLVFGVLGYYLHKFKFPMPGLIIGMILGKISESNFHRAMQISSGSFGTFFQRPMSLILFLIIIFMLGSTFLGAPIKKVFSKRQQAA